MRKKVGKAAALGVRMNGNPIPWLVLSEAAFTAIYSLIFEENAFLSLFLVSLFWRLSYAPVSNSRSLG